EFVAVPARVTGPTQVAALVVRVRYKQLLVSITPLERQLSQQSLFRERGQHYVAGGMDDPFEPISFIVEEADLTLGSEEATRPRPSRALREHEFHRGVGVAVDLVARGSAALERKSLGACFLAVPSELREPDLLPDRISVDRLVVA